MNRALSFVKSNRIPITYFTAWFLLIFFASYGHSMMGWPHAIYFVFSWIPLLLVCGHAIGKGIFLLELEQHAIKEFEKYEGYTKAVNELAQPR